MRRTNASPVYVFGEVKRPVYHLAGGWSNEQRGVVTACGKVIYAQVENGHFRDRATRMRFDWVQQIEGARLCRKCASRKRGA